MPPRPRIHIDDTPLHVVQRGHNRGACFFDGQDCHAYLGWLREALRREHCQLYAYVLMTNHVGSVAKNDDGERKRGYCPSQRRRPKKGGSFARREYIFRLRTILNVDDAGAAIGDGNDPYGGMGRNRAQSTPETEGVLSDLLDVGGNYELSEVQVANLNADHFISNHGDVRGTQSAYAIVNGVAAR